MSNNHNMALEIAGGNKILDTLRDKLTCGECGTWATKGLRVCPKGCVIMCTPCASKMLMTCCECNTGGMFEVEFLNRLSKSIQTLVMLPCPYEERGCIEWREPAHLEAHKERCVFSPIPCIAPACGRSIDRGKFAYHLLTHGNSACAVAPTAVLAPCATPLYPKEIYSYASVYRTQVTTRKANLTRMRALEEGKKVELPPFLLLRDVLQPIRAPGAFEFPIPKEVFVIGVSREESGFWIVSAWTTQVDLADNMSVTLNVSGKGNTHYGYRGSLNLYPRAPGAHVSGLFLPPFAVKPLEREGEEEISHFLLRVVTHNRVCDQVKRVGYDVPEGDGGMDTCNSPD